MEVRFTRIWSNWLGVFAAKFPFAHVGVKFLQIVNRQKLVCQIQLINAENFLFCSSLSHQLHARISHARDLFTRQCQGAALNENVARSAPDEGH